MPRIPVVQSTDALSGGIPAEYARTPTSSAPNVGSALMGIGDTLLAQSQVYAREEIANRVASADYTKRFLDRQGATQPGAAGFYEDTKRDFATWVDENTNGITDNTVRREVKSRLMARQGGVLASAAQFERGAGLQNAKDQADVALDTLQNRVRSDPLQFDAVLADGTNLINSRGDIPPGLKPAMVRKLTEQLALRRFEALSTSASTPEAVDGIHNELTKDDTWKSRMEPAQYDRILDNLGVIKKTIKTQQDTAARSTLTSLTERNNAGTLIDPAELAVAERTVIQSGNPALIDSMAVITQQQTIYRTEGRLPPHELNGRINAAKGEPSAIYPSLPPTVSGAIDEASRIVGGRVSPAFLGATAVREYGGYLRRPASQAPAAFRAQAANENVDLRNISPTVLDAAGVAGSIFGRPLVVSSGYRSQDRQDAIRAGRDTPQVARHSHHTAGSAIDISTVGMSEEEKGKLVDSLVQAGFTGFGEYDTHIHADMRKSVPSSFGERDGRTWGGWTYLSPRVSEALRARDFKADAPAEGVNRYGAGGQRRDVSMDWKVDYGQKNPKSDATGLYQFMPKTWLEVVRPNAEVLGIDGKMTDDQLLALRRDPVLSAKAAAIYADSNKRVLESSLGRAVTDPELYMAHFFGPTGAVAFLRAEQSNPWQSAAALMPKAAADNYNVFYDRDGGARTVAEVHRMITTEFSTAPSRVAFVQNEARQRIQRERDRELKRSPMDYARSVGSHAISALDSPQAFTTRGKDALNVADYWMIPREDMQPLTVEEKERFAKQLQDGTADEIVALRAQIAGLGPEMARAAFKQLGATDPVFEHAGNLAAATGRDDTAGVILRGQKRLKENPDVKKSFGNTFDTDVSMHFNAMMADALVKYPPRAIQQIQDAATAHYVQTHAGRRTNVDRSEFQNSVNAVLGGEPGAAVVDTVNSRPTILPPGLTGRQLDTALDRMTPDDYIKFSVDGSPPRYSDGSMIAPDEIAREGAFRAVGGNQYMIEMANGRFALAGMNPNGTARAYLFKMDVEEVKRTLGRPITRLPVADPTFAPTGFMGSAP